MFKCMSMYKRSENILEIQEGRLTRTQSEACSYHNMNEEMLSFTMLIRRFDHLLFMVAIGRMTHFWLLLFLQERSLRMCLVQLMGIITWPVWTWKAKRIRVEVGLDSEKSSFSVGKVTKKSSSSEIAMAKKRIRVGSHCYFFQPISRISRICWIDQDRVD